MLFVIGNISGFAITAHITVPFSWYPVTAPIAAISCIAGGIMAAKVDARGKCKK
jgi:hypothetical protein